MQSSCRFEEVIKKYGFKIRKIAFRQDIKSVQFQNKHLFTIPTVMYDHKSTRHCDMTGTQHPDYYECEQKANAWNIKVKRTDFLEEDWNLEREQDYVI
jgi:hypothetical protein